MATRMQQRRGTAAEWAADNPVLADGELGFERDTFLIKMGDGVTAWNDLEYPTERYLKKTGGTIAGSLLVDGGLSVSGALTPAAPTDPSHAARLGDIPPPPSLSGLATETYVNTQRDTRVAKTGDTMTGQLTMNEQRVTRPELLGYQEHEVALADATMTVNFLNGQLYRSTRSGALTIAWSSTPASGKVRVCTLLIPTSVTGITWPAGTKFPGGEAPALDGETWISAVARGSVVTVGTAWSGVA